MRSALIFAAIAALAFTSAADAKSCKDATGKFVKCPAEATVKADTKVAKTSAKAAKADAKVAKAASKGAVKAAKAAPAPAPAPAAPMAAAAPAAAHAKNCKKGKACGNSCIKMTDVCHK